VDGPAGAGKSTVARELARRLSFQYLDTGATYRAVTWRALAAGTDLDDPCALTEVAREAEIELRPGEHGMLVRCDGRDITGEIRTPEVTNNIYRLADEPAVRQVLIEIQRRFGRRYDLVAEGRDQGTDVFPGADVKFYLDASLKERVRRRMKDMQGVGRRSSFEEVRDDVRARDVKDRSRPVGALRKADDMIVIDSTGLSVDQVVELMLEHVERLRAARGG
jgi:cytidylate kinase